jgi:hypothetical protein
MTELEFTPFADDTAAATVGGLTVENGLGCLAVFGTLVIGRTEKDLAVVRHLAALLGKIEAAIIAGPGEEVPVEAARVEEVQNPF